MTRITLHESAVLAWALANSEALKSTSTHIKPIHLFAASLRIIDRLYEKEAREAGIEVRDPEELVKISNECRNFLGLNDDQLTILRRDVRSSYLEINDVYPDRLLHRSSETRDIFRRAAVLASRELSNSLTLFHLLFAILDHPSREILRSFQSLNLEIPTVSPIDTDLAPEDVSLPLPALGSGARSITPVLDQLGRDLTALAKSGRLPPIVGRDKEIKVVARHLLRTTKRNVLLVGKAGTGKTAIVEGLAERLASEEAPKELTSLRIVEVSVASIVAGTRYRGDMEERLSRIIDEATSDPNIVLFLDEVHIAVGAGSGGEGIDVASILTPALSREDIKCIGATTFEDFERYIKTERAFLRRFQIVRVNEPTIDEAIEICEQWAKRIEETQGVHFDNSAIVAAVELSDILIKDRFLPDKAIDLLENAATYVKISTLIVKQRVPQKTPEVITNEEIRFVLEEQYGIKPSKADSINPTRIGEALRQNLVGQECAIEDITRTLSALIERPSSSQKPLAVFLFMGPTGVGKTYSVEIIAEALAGDGDNKSLGRFNMNEYKERHELSRLIGAPPGFIGHNQYGVLFRFVEEQPQGVILLDEIEKAHPEILDYFMQIFDKGEGRDSRGNVVDFGRQFVVMTCNHDVPKAHRRMGFKIESDEEDKREIVLKNELKMLFKKEFLSRIDKVVLFEELSLENYVELFDRHATELICLLTSEYGITLRIDEGVKSEISEIVLALREGARGLARIFNQQLVTVVMEHSGEMRGKTLNVSWDGGIVLSSDQS